MAAHSYQQTDTAGLSTGVPWCGAANSNSNYAGRYATVGGSAGSSPFTAGIQASGTNQLLAYFNLTVPTFTAWTAGTWTVRINITTANMYLTMTAVYICRVNSSGTSQETIGSATGLSVSLGSTGVITQNVTGIAGSGAVGDNIVVAIYGTNSSSMSTSSVGITPNQLITSPQLPGSFTQTDFRVRNDNGDEASATWRAALNVTPDISIDDKFRIRVRVTVDAPGSTAFGWQYEAFDLSGFTSVSNKTGIGTVQAMHFSPDGTKVAVGSTTSPYLRVYLTSDWSLVAGTPTLAGPVQYRGAVKWSPDGSMLAVGHQSGNHLTVYDTSDWSIVTEKAIGTNWVDCVDWSPSGAHLAVIYDMAPKGVIIYETTNWTEVSTAFTNQGQVKRCAYSPNGNYLAVGMGGPSSPGYYILDTSNYSLVTGLPNPSLQGGLGLGWSPDSAYLIIGFQLTPFLKMLRLSDKTWVAGTPTAGNQVLSAGWSADATMVAVGWNNASPYNAVYKVSDWSTLTSPTYSAQINEVQFKDSDTLAMVGPSADFLQITDPGSWAAMPAQSTGAVPIRFAESSNGNISDTTQTTQQIGAGTFAAGRMYESNHTNQTSFSAAGSTELEAVLETVSGVATEGQIIRVRAVREA